MALGTISDVEGLILLSFVSACETVKYFLCLNISQLFGLFVRFLQSQVCRSVYSDDLQARDHDGQKRHAESNS